MVGLRLSNYGSSCQLSGTVLKGSSIHLPVVEFSIFGAWILDFFEMSTMLVSGDVL